LSNPSTLQTAGYGASSFLNSRDVLSDLANAVTSFRNRCNVDRRSIAIGVDSDFFLYDAMLEISGEFAEVANLGWTQNKMWYELARPHDASPEKKYKVLSIAMIPVTDSVSELASNSVSTCFVNNLDLYYFERFYIESIYQNEFGPLLYQVADHEDVLSGVMDEEFDFVRIPSKLSFLPNMQTLDKYMDATKVGGIFLLNQAADYGDMYMEEKTEFSNYYFDMCKHIAEREDFMVFNVPYDIGMVVCKRVNS
jgi:hypothetical protein